MFVISSIGHGFVLYFCLRSSKRSELIIKECLIVLYTYILLFLTLKFGLYAKIFIRVFPDYGFPNAGSGFGVLISLVMNAVVSFLVFIVLFAINKSKKNDNASEK